MEYRVEQHTGRLRERLEGLRTELGGES